MGRQNLRWSGQDRAALGHLGTGLLGLLAALGWEIMLGALSSPLLTFLAFALQAGLAGHFVLSAARIMTLRLPSQIPLRVRVAAVLVPALAAGSLAAYLDELLR